jgi:hypothetical protein
MLAFSRTGMIVCGFGLALSLPFRWYDLGAFSLLFGVVFLFFWFAATMKG